MHGDRFAAVRERRIRGGQLDQRHLGGTQRQRRISVELGSDAEAIGGPRDRNRTEFEGEPDRDRVERLRQRLLERDRAVIFVAIIFRLPSLEGDRLVLPHRFRCETTLESGEINERLERRAGLALGSHRAVELALGVVPAAHHGAHGTVGGDRDDCALGDFELLSLRSKLVH